MTAVLVSTENAEMTAAARAVWELVLTLGEGRAQVGPGMRWPEGPGAAPR